MKIIIIGDPRTKKNHSRLVYRGGRTFLIPSQQYQKYESEFIAQCMEQGIWNKNLNYRMNIECKYYMHTRRRVDLNNLLEGTTDCLVAAKVITDDESKIVAGHDGSRVLYDKENPRVEITITELEEGE